MDERNRVYRAYIAAEVKIREFKMTNQNDMTAIIKLMSLEAEKKSLYS